MASDDSPRCPACGTVCAYTSDSQRGTWGRYCGGLRCMNVWPRPETPSAGMTWEEWESIGRKHGWLPWTTGIEAARHLGQPVSLTPELREARDRAQARADQLGHPVKLTITPVISGEFGPPTTVWVEPLESIGQWTTIRSPDGTETPVHTSALDV